MSCPFGYCVGGMLQWRGREEPCPYHSVLKQGKTPCPECHGSGNVHSHNPICWECDGRGWVK